MSTREINRCAGNMGAVHVSREMMHVLDVSPAISHVRRNFQRRQIAAGGTDDRDGVHPVAGVWSITWIICSDVSAWGPMINGRSLEAMGLVGQALPIRYLLPISHTMPEIPPLGSENHTRRQRAIHPTAPVDDQPWLSVR